MLRRDLKVVGNHLSRCNNSGPRNMRENHYAILARLKISYVLKSQDKHNASYFSKMSWSGKTFPSAKLTKIFENERIGEKKNSVYETPDTERANVSWNGNFSQPMHRVSKASVPSVRCSSRSSSLSASFSPDLSLRKPLRPLETPAD